MAFLLTDGESTQYDFDEVLDDLRDYNVTIYGIGVGNVSMTQLNMIAGSEANRTMYVEKFDQLKTIQDVSPCRFLRNT